MVEGQVEPIEITEIQRLHHELTGRQVTQIEIEDEVRQAYEDDLDAAEMVRRIGRSLGGEGAKIVAQFAYQVARATGSVSEKRQAQLDQFPAGLGISAEGFQQLIAEVGDLR
jgi:tellurite resistance protein